MELAPRIRERWTEEDLDALPSGEHDYFDRKSGLLFDGDKGAGLDHLAKAMSALANSGGGHLIIGMTDDGVPDGVQPSRGRTSTREWLEQKIPGLLAYPLTGFRVHEAEPSTPSSIPAGRVVLVIDVPDSPAAPHQSTRDKVYYHRGGGHSRPADHFYLELLRQRALSPMLEAAVTGFRIMDAYRHDDVPGSVFVESKVDFVVRNVGRVAAYKWHLKITHADGVPDDTDIRVGVSGFPKKGSRSSAIRMDDTILPTLESTEVKDIGIVLNCDGRRDKDLWREVHARIAPLVLKGHLVGETRVGDTQDFDVSALIDANAAAAEVFRLVNASGG